MTDEKVFKFEIERHPVVCYQTDSDRRWRCGCAYFQRTVAIYKEGFCPHVAVAIEVGSERRHEGLGGPLNSDVQRWYFFVQRARPG